MKAGDVTVTSNGAAGEANGVRMEANFNSTIDEDGNRVRKQGEVNVETGDITAKAETGNAVGAYSYAYGSIVNAETGSVTARGNGDVTGVSVQASDLIGRDIDDNMFRMDGEATTNVDGDITAASAHGTATAVMTNVNNGAEATVTVEGDVTATSKDSEATGIAVTASKDSETDVVVVGDVSAEGKEKGVGISVQNDNADVDIVVDGTVSGSANAIEVLTSQTVNGQVQATMDVADTALTVWAAEENEDGHVAVAVDRNIVPGNEEHPAPTITDTVNEEATKALEASINYIVKIGTDFLQKVTAAGAKGNTVTIGETTYATANEGEDVNVGVTLDSENEVLEGVYYNAEDETTLTKAEDLKKDEQGGFLMKMLRGGAMLLGLKVHTHVYEYKYNNDATCTADGTKTAKCDRCDATDTVVDPDSKKGHKPDDAVQENYIAAGPGYGGSYDAVVYCTVCKEELSRETILIPALPVADRPAQPAPETKKELVFKAVDDEEEVNGVKASDQPEMEKALKEVAENLVQAEYTKISIPAMEEVLDEKQQASFESLPVQEQLTLVLCALGYSEEQESLSQKGAELLEEIQEKIDISVLLGQFSVVEAEINGKVCQTFQIEISIEKDGVSSYVRYIFFNDEGVWKLFRIEKGDYVDVVI